MRLVANEDTLQMYVKDLMDSPRADKRVVWFHVPNESKAPVQYRVKLKKKGVLAGVADCIFFMPDDWPCRYLCLELKDGTKGRTSDSQKQFRDRVQVIGGAYAVARTPEEIDRALMACGILMAPAKPRFERAAFKVA